CSDPSDDLAARFGEKILGVGVLEERILAGGEEDPHVPTQRRDPDRVPRVQPVGQVDEAVEIGAGPYRANVDGSPGGNGGAQMTSNSRPMVANASRQKSVWSKVWVAMTLVRRRHCEGGTAGGATGLV